MLASKTYVGERLDLEHYKGYPVMQYAVTITDSDDEAYPLEDFASITFDLYAKQYGKLLDSADVPVPTDNVLLIDLDEDFFDRRPTLYYHECYGMTNSSPSEKVLLFHGVSEI